MAEQSLFVEARHQVSQHREGRNTPIDADVLWGVEAVLALESTWRDLFERNYADSPFSRWEWFEAWWNHFGSHLESNAKSVNLVAILARVEGRIVGLACFYYVDYGWPSLEPRSLRPVGVLGYRHSDLTEEPILLMEAGLEDELLPFFHSELGKLLKDFDFVQLHAIAKVEAKTEHPCRKKMLLGHGYWHESTQMLNLGLTDSWESFLAGLSAKSQEHVKRKPRALAKRCKEWRVELATAGQTEFAVDELVRLHRSRAEAAKNRTIHIISREHRLFYRDYFQRMAEAGLGGIFLLWADDKVIAAQSVLFGKHDWLLFHQGHDPEWGQVSPMVILQMEAFQMAIRRGAPQVRLHRFAQEWKLRWGAKPSGYFDQWIAIKRMPLSMLRTLLYSKDSRCLDILEDSP